ncbi:DUF58 domain-containing protein [Mariniblastus sp.]|nr:DUF58 domain-containing protein [Mariniblastus sp.]
MSFPLWLLARRSGVFPAKRLLLLFLIPALMSFFLVILMDGGGARRTLLLALLLIDVALVGTAFVDLMRIVPPSVFSGTRTVQRIASQGKRQKVEIEIINHSKTSCVVALKDDLPDSFVAEPSRLDTSIAGRSRLQFIYELTGQKRGRVVLECIHLMVGSPFKLWQGFYRLPNESIVNVYPDMKQIAEYDLLARTNRLNLMGLRRTRKIGQDNEFERLRDYTQDDNYKHIDWRTSARRNKLTVRDFQANQSQRILFMVDCGRMMTGTAGEISLLDHSLNAMLMLSYIALRQGDSVGMLSFSDRIHNFTPAKNGVKHINRLLNASYDQQARYVESRYDDAFLYLRSHCSKRSLVILVTNVIDEINSHQINQYLTSLTGRHLPLGVFLRDREMFSAVEEFELSGQPGKKQIYEAAAAVEVLNWRRQVIRDLRHQGALAMDLFPEDLTSELINQYMQIKARHLL